MRRSLVVKAAVALALVALVVGIYLSPLREHVTLAGIRAALQRFSHVWYGPIVYIAAYATGCVLFLPASAFILAAAVIWGWKLGGLYAIIGGSLGAFSSFELGRYVVGDFAWKILASRGPRLSKVMGKAGFRTLLTLRLVPGIPFPVYNYAAGLTAVRTRDFYLSTVLGIAGPTFIIAYSADALVSGALTGPDAAKRFIVICLLLAALVLLSFLLKRRVAPDLADEP